MKELKYGKVYQMKEVRGKETDIVACYVNGIVEYIDQRYEGEEYLELVLLDNELKPIELIAEPVKGTYSWFVKDIVEKHKCEFACDTIDYDIYELEFDKEMEIPTEKLQAINQFIEN